MKINLWGVRGSLPTTGPETSGFGGNTSCTSVTHEGWLLVLDGGSGIHTLVLDKDAPSKRIDILLTHLHIDHIQGLGFFSPLFDPEMEIHIWGPASSHRSLHSRLSRYLSPPLFPVLIRDLPCTLQFHELENSTVEIGPFQVQSSYVIHPSPTIGFRIANDHSTFTYLPDHEPALGFTGMIPNNKWISGIDLAAGVDLLLHDAQYTLAEYQTRKGWGHSSIDDAGYFASMAGVKKLLLAHHDPSHNDEKLLEMFSGFQQQNDYPFACELAREGMEIML
ncbi:MAG TPA: MBL fold metallo-hydrolase [Chitinophagales bacterium]|nr:MBL fold metallo-hydrolase [Chitinophagales bacterium]